MDFISMFCEDVHDAWNLSGPLRGMAICNVVLWVCAFLQVALLVYRVLSICFGKGDPADGPMKEQT